MSMHILRAHPLATLALADALNIHDLGELGAARGAGLILIRETMRALQDVGLPAASGEPHSLDVGQLRRAAQELSTRAADPQEQPLRDRLAKLLALPAPLVEAAGEPVAGHVAAGPATAVAGPAACLSHLSAAARRGQGRAWVGTSVCESPPVPSKLSTPSGHPTRHPFHLNSREVPAIMSPVTLSAHDLYATWRTGKLIPGRITLARARANMPQTELADACGTDPCTVDLWEQGVAYPSWEEFIDIAVATEHVLSWFGQPLRGPGCLFVVPTTPEFRRTAGDLRAACCEQGVRDSVRGAPRMQGAL